MKASSLALRFLWREGRSGELTILLIALIIAISSSTAVSLFSDRLQQTLLHQTAEFLAGDLSISSSNILPTVWNSKAKKHHLKQAETIEFSTMLVENDQLLLVGIKAVSPLYPLRGGLKNTQTDYTQEKPSKTPPQRGNVWVDARVLSALKLKIGDTITIGEKKLVITSIITYEPDKRGDFYSLSPRVMMSTLDLIATRVIRKGSHVHYFTQFSGEETDLMAFKRWGKTQLTPSQRIMDIYQDRPELGSALKNTKYYLSLSSIVVVLISGIAVAMAARRYTERHFNTAAILRCLGCTQREILRVYTYQFLYLGIFAGIIGCSLGWLGQEQLFQHLRNLFPSKVAEPYIFSIVLGFLTGLIILANFTLPPLLRLKKVSALRVLRNELEPISNSAWLIYSSTFILVSFFLWHYTDDYKSAILILSGSLLVVLVLGLGLYKLLLKIKSRVNNLPLCFRFGAQALLQNPKTTVIQLLAFSLTLVSILLSLVLSQELINDWQTQLPEKNPNHFALNLFPDHLKNFNKDLINEKIKPEALYPIVKGRLTKINGKNVHQQVTKDSQGQRAVQRDLSLTYSLTLPEYNTIIAGDWWKNTAPEKGQVSIEKKLAKSLDIDVNDELTFSIGSEEFKATVSSIRKVRWQTMRPNFYMIFSPATLENYAKTYLTSFYLPKENQSSLKALIKKYPSIMIFKVDTVLAQLKTLLLQVTQSINALSYFALLAGFCVLFAAIASTLDQRFNEGVIMRTLGARQSLLRCSYLLEFSLLGFVAGLLAIIIAEALIFGLYFFILQLDYHFHWLLWAATPIVGMLVVMIAGCLGVRKIITTPPARLLQITRD
ncbi:MAG: FtsX-like permease family protein [Methylococcales bacterium]|nr:FtsX-like permease family protein [Methylococcales bacterium]